MDRQLRFAGLLISARKLLQVNARRWIVRKMFEERMGIGKDRSLRVELPLPLFLLRLHHWTGAPYFGSAGQP